jgi:[acyl-carrier-protein] S-malonyltransferase
LPSDERASTSLVEVIALLAPGQGAQTPGMLVPWLQRPGAAAMLAEFSAAAEIDLLALGTSADADTIRDTAVAQPLLTAAALLSLAELEFVPDVVLGHSIGELAALAAADVIDPTIAVRLAAERGRAMAAAAALTPTGMVAVLGGDNADVLAVADRLGLEVATVNVAGQVVLGGTVKALDALAAAPPVGARVRRLETAGAFHTQAMAAAVPRLAELVAQTVPRDPRCAVIANADGAVVRSGRELLDRLVGQLTGPVRFDLCLQTLAGLAPSTVMELAPGGTLTAMAKRALPGVTLTGLRTRDDVPVPA